MPPSKKKPAPKKTTPKKAAKKPAASAKRVTRKPRSKVAVPAIPPSTVPADEQGFHAAIMQAPDDLTVHLVYADWLARQGHPTRAAALGAWAELVRVPLTAGIAQVRIAYQH